jgi:peptidoglycan/xylan/chitin deacetylase (PgdA/CDA1 family)
MGLIDSFKRFDMNKCFYALLSNDVETTSIWYNDLRDKTGERVLKEAMPALLELYRKHDVKATFFYTAYIAKLFPEIVRMIIEDGHEIGSHGKSHLVENGFDIMPFEKQKNHLDYSKKLLEDISGSQVISFRAPALRVSPITASALIETGFLIDSSIASQRFDFFLSFGSKQKLSFLNAPRLPYYTKADNIYAKGSSPLLEVPSSAFIMPYTGSTIRILPTIARLQRHLLHYESRLTQKPLVFYLHPNEFVDESDEPRVIKRRSSNPIKYLLTDIIRAYLKTKNLGPVAFPLYDRMIRFYAVKGYDFLTMMEYRKRVFFGNQ